MEEYEKIIRQVDTLNNESAQKHNQLFTDTIYKLARSSLNNSSSLDSQFSRYFPEIQNLGKTSSEPFNPKYVCEMRDGKGHQMIEEWNKDLGILPDRKVMGSFQLVNLVIAMYNSYSTTVFIGDKMKISGLGTPDKKALMIPTEYRTSHNIHQHMYDAEYNNLKSYIISQKLYHSDFNDLLTVYKTFEYDNYLNLYDTSTGLYLMFNKTSFPLMAFFMRPNIFYKKLDPNSASFMITNNYTSRDARPNFLSQINQVIPDDYNEVFKFYDRFRKFDGFKKGFILGGFALVDSEIQIETKESGAIYCDGLLKSSNPEDQEVESTKDQIIKQQQIKLNETLAKVEKLSQSMNDLVEKFTTKSNESLDFQRQLHLLEMNSKNATSETIETLNKEVFQLNAKLGQYELFETQNNALDLSIKSLKREIDSLKLDLSRQKDITKGLVTQVQNEKTRGNELQENNTKLRNECLTLQNIHAQIEIEVKKVKSEIFNKTEECNRMSEHLRKTADNSSNALENALNDRVKELEDNNRELLNKSRELVSDKKILEDKLMKMKNSLKGFIDL